VQSDLNLQGATSLATTFRELLPSDADVRGAAAIVETCRRGEAWRVDRSAMEQLRLSLAFGLTPPLIGTRVTLRPRPARVLVVLPGPRYRSDVYVAEVRRRLRRSAGAPVPVQVVKAPHWDDLTARTMAAAASWRPLAVLVAPPAGVRSAEATAAAATALRGLGERLRLAGQPAVLSAQLPMEATATVAAASAAPTTDVLAAALRASGLPISPLAGSSAASAGGHVAARTLDARLTAAARANVATLVRACWPGTLAPRLASTRLGFSFAARRRTIVGVSAATSSAVASAAALLRTWGYQTTIASFTGWTPPRTGPGVYYRAGMRRAALALAGDLGPRAAVVADEGAPAALTLCLER
jgi:hypothetical protein